MVAHLHLFFMLGKHNEVNTVLIYSIILMPGHGVVQGSSVKERTGMS